MSAQVEVGEKHRIHPNSLLNLREPWRKGECPNPGGVKKGQVFISECYKRLLLLNPTELREYQPRNAAEAMALRQVIAGIFGMEALPAVKEITDRTEGKAAQKVEHSGQVNHLVLQIQIFEQTAAELATKHGVPIEEARESLFAARPELREMVVVGY